MTPAEARDFATTVYQMEEAAPLLSLAFDTERDPDDRERALEALEVLTPGAPRRPMPPPVNVPADFMGFAGAVAELLVHLFHNSDPDDSQRRRVARLLETVCREASDIVARRERVA